MPGMIKSHQETYPNCVNLLNRLAAHCREPRIDEHERAPPLIHIFWNFTTISCWCSTKGICSHFYYTKTPECLLMAPEMFFSTAFIALHALRHVCSSNAWGKGPVSVYNLVCYWRWQWWCYGNYCKLLKGLLTCKNLDLIMPFMHNSLEKILVQQKINNHNHEHHLFLNNWKQLQTDS